MTTCNNKKLKYPILLIHGMGFRDDLILGYWGRIPKVLTKEGAQIFHGCQDSNASIQTNGEHILKRIDEVLKETGAQKVNIIAHSKGGLDARYAISTLKAYDRVASLTTIATPHHGSKTVDLLLKFPDVLVKITGAVADFFCRIMGDKHPSSYEVFHSFRTDTAKKFNADNPDSDKVYYQSYTCIMKNSLSDIVMFFPHLVVNLVEGENDGLVTSQSAQWTNFKGIYTGNTNRGISHCDEVDFRRRRLSKKSGEGIDDICNLYIQIIKELYDLGF